LKKAFVLSKKGYAHLFFASHTLLLLLPLTIITSRLLSLLIVGASLSIHTAAALPLSFSWVVPLVPTMIQRKPMWDKRKTLKQVLSLFLW